MRKRLILVVASSVALIFSLKGQEATPETPAVPVLTPEQQAIANQANAFIAAYNKADVKTLAAIFTEDAEWVDDGGNVLAGRDAIASHFKDVFLASKGRYLDIDVESVRPLTSDVMLEKGTTTITEADGRNSVSSYTAVHIKKGDAWLISQFTETGSPLAGNAARQLSELEWLVGSWADSKEGGGVVTKSTIEWALNNNFLTWTYSVVAADGEESSGTQVIGWDSTIGKIRSWVFDGDGSFSEKTWTQDGNRWLLLSRTVLPDGGQGTEEQTITRVDKDKFTWASASRQVDGEALPNIGPVTIVRSK
ncbi:MAG: SgcJ/EcaC family oxidoreductase [Verrucomicrobiales bacterium]